MRRYQGQTSLLEGGGVVTRRDRIHARLRIASDLYRLACEEGNGGLRGRAEALCHGARLMAQDTGQPDLAVWALRCAEVCMGVSRE